MRLFLDENLPTDFVGVFEAAGHDVVCAKDAGLAGAADEAIWRHCLERHRVLVTLDTDFSDRRRFDPSVSDGILWIRTSKGQTLADLCAIVLTALRKIDAESLRGKIAIIHANRVRIR